MAFSCGSSIHHPARRVFALQNLGLSIGREWVGLGRIPTSYKWNVCSRVAITEQAQMINSARELVMCLCCGSESMFRITAMPVPA
jgi:hypothetical protein